ncbi:MAG: sugar ABC transporter permease [Gemmatimonadota bacterium]|nr:MAG: sugar ABC transporter permease [Gemmatimonadota bacterium]
MASISRREARTGWLFLAPALLLLGVFFLVPVLSGLALSLTDFDAYAIGSPDLARFVGIDNYVQTLASDEFWAALRNTLYFAVLAGPLSILVSLGAALLVDAPITRARAVFRVAYFVPVVTTLVAVAIVWRYLYHPRYGVLNFLLGLVGVDPIHWLGDPHWAMPAIVILAVWKNFGYNMLIFVAGLQSVPKELYEVAAVDGAGRRHQFLHITVPSLAPIFLFVGITTMIGSFQVFAEPYVMTQGGPLGSTRTLLLHMYEEGFRWWRLGTASTIAVLLLILTLIGTAVQLRLRPDRNDG